MQVVDARDACCQDTLASPIKKAAQSCAPGEVLEVLITPSFRHLLSKLAQEEQYAVLEEAEREDGVHVQIRSTAEPPAQVLKVEPVGGYPTEGGCFLQGNHYSPVGVVVLLNAPYGTLPAEVQGLPDSVDKLIRVAIETGAALAGTLQTENIGIEKIICNVVGNPNIRRLVLCGQEVSGHSSGSAFRALLLNGINAKRAIVGSQAVTPYLLNVPLEAIERFREQITLVDLTGEADPEVVGKAVWSCYQEKPTPFRDHVLYDPGAYAQQGIAATLSGKVPHPEAVEEWELEEVLRQIDAPEGQAGLGETAPTPEVGGKEAARSLGEARIRSFLRKQLRRLSEELADLAELLGEEGETTLPPRPTGLPNEPVAKPQPTPVVQAKPPEESPKVQESPALNYFTSQLRGFHNVLAGLEACDRDICHGGRSLPLAVVSTLKKLGRLRAALERATLPAEDKGGLTSKLEAYWKRLEALPQEPGPCQKTVGTCTIGPGCFAAAAADFIKLVKEPQLPPECQGGEA